MSKKGDQITERGRCLVAYLGTGANPSLGSIFLNPTTATNCLGVFSTRLNALASVYQMFRFTKILIEIIPTVFTSTQPQDMTALGLLNEFAMLCFTPVLTAAAPSTISVAESCPWQTPFIGKIGNSNATVGQTMIVSPIDMVRKSIPKKILMSQPTKWFRTGVGTTYSVADLALQGSLSSVCVSSRTSTYANVPQVTYVVEFECQFKDFISVGLVPRSLKDAGAAEDEPVEVTLCRDRILVQTTPNEKAPSSSSVARAVTTL